MFTASRIRRKAFSLGRRAIRYAGTHKAEMLRLGVMAAIVLVPEVGFAAETDSSAHGFDVIATPLENLQKYATGKFARTATTIGAIAGAGSFMINSDNQVVKKGMQVTGAGGLLCGIPTLINAVFGFTVP